MNVLYKQALETEEFFPMQSTLSPLVQEKLTSMGFYAIESNIPRLTELASTLAHNALEGKKPCFEAFPSYIPAFEANATAEYVLIVDIGGTSCKAALRSIDAKGSEKWNILFDEKNAAFKPDRSASNSAFLDFTMLLANKVRERLEALNLTTSQVCGAAFVWSNAMSNQRAENRSITGFVEDRAHYAKGEWFIEDLQDGKDLGAVFKQAFAANGFPQLPLLLANDTTLTMKAQPHAHAGMVASTGLNGTLVNAKTPDSPIICNGEIGGRFFIPHDLLTAADLATHSDRSDTAERLTAGRFLPRLFVSYIELLATQGVTELAALAAFHATQEDAGFHCYRAKDMNLLLFNKPEFISRRQEPELYTEPVLEILTDLTRALFQRSSFLAALVAYATVVTQLPNQEKLIVAMDSRLAREIDGFAESMQHYLETMTPDGKTIKAELVSPLIIEEGYISVPMQGAARALDTLLSA